MAGLTKAQIAEKKAKEEKVEVVDTEKKYRHNFDTWGDFNKYKGVKG